MTRQSLVETSAMSRHRRHSHSYCLSPLHDQAFLAQVVQRYGDRVLLQPGVQRPANGSARPSPAAGLPPGKERLLLRRVTVGTPIWMARAAIGTRTAEPVDEARRRGVQVRLVS